MVRNLIIQIFIEGENKLEDFPNFVMNKNNWESYCDKMGLEYMFFDKYNIRKYLGEHEKFYYALDFTWQRIDFIRYLILNKEGGVYIDLDIYPHKNKDFFDLLEQRYLLNYWTNPKTGIREVTNSIMGCEPGDFDELIKYSIGETERCRKIAIYQCWKIRYMKQTTGVCMFKRWIKIRKWGFTQNMHDYIVDECSSTWTKNFH